MRRLLMALVVLLFLAGCGSTPTSPTLPPLSAGVPGPASGSASAPASPGPTGVISSHRPGLRRVVEPAEASVHDEAGAMAFARYWLAELNAAQEALDASKLIELSAPGCGTCRNFIDSFKRNALEGNYYVGGASTIRSADSPPLDEKGAEVQVVIDYAELLVYSKTGELIKTVAADKRIVLTVTTTWSGSHWLVSQVSQGT